MRPDTNFFILKYQIGDEPGLVTKHVKDRVWLDSIHTAARKAREVNARTLGGAKCQVVRIDAYGNWLQVYDIGPDGGPVLDDISPEAGDTINNNKKGT